MIQPITIERWNQAQEAERKMHNMTLEEGIEHYRISYAHNFRYLGIDPDADHSDIIEIGCADFPALRYLRDKGGKMPIIIEPMPSVNLKKFCDDFDIYLLEYPLEKVFLHLDGIRDCEVWLFNVLQHVQDPELCIEKIKVCKTIRYFEPIDTGITDYHPHSFTQDDFERWFPGVNKYYNESNNPCFHDGPCCYGVWENKGV